MQTNLAISTVHRLLNDLVRASLLERADGASYRPGAGLRGLPSSAGPARCAPGRRSSSRTSRRRCTPPRASGSSTASRSPTSRRRRGRSRARCSPTRPGCPCTRRPWARRCSPSGHDRWSGSSAAARLPRYTTEDLVRPIDLERALQRIRAHGFALADGELHPRCRCRRRARVRRPRAGRSPRSRWTSARAAGGGRARGSRVADGRAVPAPGVTPAAPPAPSGRTPGTRTSARMRPDGRVPEGCARP